MRALLLNPGPVSLSEGVRRAAVSEDLCHRESEFFELQDEVRAALTALYGCAPDEWSAVLLGGSGTTALEAMIASLVPRSGRLLVLENGVYGERLTRIAQIHGIAFDSVKFDWLDAWNLDSVRDALTRAESRGATFSHVAAVHHETTTGRLNPVSALANLCQEQGVKLLLDTVSSFGAESIPFESSALVACAVTANKCLHGIPGLCFVLAKRITLKSSAEPPRSLYLDLKLWSGHQERQSTPFTPAVNGLLALRQALAEMKRDGGWKARHARYTRLATAVARALSVAGVEPFLPAADSSSVLRAYHLPAGMSYEAVHDGMKQRGFIIYAGQGGLMGRMFRISTMGDISDYDLQRLESALASVFQ